MGTTVSDTGKKERMENVWIRLLYMILYFIIHRLATVVLYLLAVIQFLFTLFTKETNTKLIGFGWALNQFILQAGQFLSFETEKKPFPFADWPVQEKPAESVTSDEQPAPENDKAGEQTSEEESK